MKEIIAYPKRFLIFFLTVIVGGFVFSIIYSKWRSKNYKAVTATEKIDTINLTGDEKYGYLRGAVFYKPNRFISEAILLDVDCNNETAYEKNDSDPNTLKHMAYPSPYYLSDLSRPFILYKSTDSIINIRKQGCLMRFKLSKYDGPYK
jgi:hypothetical protein